MITLYSEVNKHEILIIREIAKKHGIKKCRMMKSKSVFIGSQLELIEKNVAESLINELKKAGFGPENPTIIDMIIEQNNLCGLMVRKIHEYHA